MPINMRDARILREKTPSSIAAVGAAVRARYKLPASAVGIRGNQFHNNGFHRSENWLRNSPDPANTTRETDYSLRGALNRSADPDTCCALDVTPGSTAQMVTMTSRVRAAALARDARLRTVQEFAGTLDGRTVTRIQCSDGKILSPFDKSHLWHWHASFPRSLALLSHAGFTAVLLGDQPTATAPQEDDDMRELTIVQEGAGGPVFLSCDMMTRRRIPNWEGPDSVVAVRYIAGELGVKLRNNGEVWMTDEAGIGAFGVEILDDTNPAPVAVTDAQLAMIIAGLIAGMPAPLTKDDVRAEIEAAEDA